MVNTATTLISPADTEKFLEALGRKAEWVRIGKDRPGQEEGRERRGVRDRN